MSDLPRVHTGEPLVRLSDDEITYRADRGKWTLTEALFYLTGHKPLGYESADHLQDHFRPAYHQAVDAIEMGNICRKIKRAGETVFIDSPANWFAWADSLGPKYIKVDKRMRRAIQKEPVPPDLTADNPAGTKADCAFKKKKVGKSLSREPVRRADLTRFIQKRFAGLLKAGEQSSARQDEVAAREHFKDRTISRDWIKDLRHELNVPENWSKRGRRN